MRSRAQHFVAVAVLVAAFAPACTQRRDPEKVFDQAWEAYQNGDLTRAQEEAKEGYDKFHAVNPEWAWKFAILRARILHLRGLDDDALDVLNLSTGSEAPGELAIKKLWILGLIHTHKRNFTKAEQEFSEAERLCQAREYPSCKDLPDARGNLDMELTRYVDAQRFFEKVLKVAREEGNKPAEASALLDLSHSAEEQAHFDEALDWAYAARNASVQEHLDGLAETALGNIGWAYFKLGDLLNGEQKTIEARNEAKRIGIRTDEVNWLNNVGLIDMDSARPADAQLAFQEALSLAKQINSREDITNALIVLAFLSEQTGKLDDAKRYADEALAMAQEDKNGRDQVYPLLVQGRLAARAHDTATAENTFREVAQSPDCPVFLKWEAERSLARLYEDENHLDAAESEYRTALTTFETARSELKHEDSRLPFLSNAARIYDDYIHFLVAQGNTAGALQVADFSRGRTLAEGLGLLQKGTSFTPELVDAREVARKAGSTILFYWLGEKRSYLWAITAKKISLFSLPAAAEIEAEVERYQKALEGPQNALESDAGVSLYQTLISPARELLPANAKVVIIPDGKLNNLNFETLPVPDPAPHYWIEDATIANASSLRLLAASRAGKQKPSRSLLLFGNAISPSPEYAELPNAAVEMASVEKHFPASQEAIFQRDQATPAAYLASDPERFSYVHFVTHGVANRLNPLDSFIVLSQSGGQIENFKLYARDIIQHPIHAELVTISACYGAGTRAYSGEGLVGLSWAFLHSGAHNVVAALWDASDVSTAQLMDKFYDGLNRGEGPDKALREAKLSLLHSDNAFRKPFYWGPFQLYSGL
ncbi:MAG: CHAT domain-containing tetratricopeptide repeat protein [Candidatus Sulfotelmatobacter sp.]